MSGTTTRLGLYLPGGGSTGAYGADEPADVDKAINQNMQKLDVVADLVNGRLGPTSAQANGDWNSYMSTGWYKGFQLANSPVNDNLYVMVQRFSDDWIAQIATELSSGTRMWKRLKTNGTWGSWLQIPNDGDLPIYARSGLNNGNSLEFLITPGVYQTNYGSGTPQGFPAGANSYGQLVIFQQGFGVTQMYFDSAAVYVRTQWNSTNNGNKMGAINWVRFNGTTVSAQA